MSIGVGDSKTMILCIDVEKGGVPLDQQLIPIKRNKIYNSKLFGVQW